MKKKNIICGIAMLSILALASCNSNSFKKDRGSVDETMPSVEIPDVLRKEGLSYTVKHELENENGEYDLVYVENLDGKKGEYTLAKALEYKGYTPLPFSQVLLSDTSVTIEIKYKANEFKLTLEDIDSSIGYVYGGGDYYAYNNEATLTAKPNIGYEFLGWYSGDTLLSSSKTYSLSLEDNMNVYGKFKVSDEFKYFDFESDQASCNIKGLIMDAPETLVIPENVTKISQEAFYDKKLTNVVLPKTLNEIEDYAFNRSSILSLTINSEINFHYSSFYNCNRLYEIYNNSLMQLSIGSSDNGYVAYNALIIHQSGEEASIFAKQDNYLYAVVNDSLTLVNYDGNDKNLVLPSEVTIEDTTYTTYSIASLAFEQNDDLIVVTLPEAIESIGTGAFNGCDNLYEVFNLSNLYITNSQSDNGGIGNKAVYIHTDASDAQHVFYNEDYIYAIDENYMDILRYTNENEKNVVLEPIDDYLITIKKRAFYENSTIETVTLGETVIAVDEYAFYKCDNLRSVHADSVKTIGTYAFGSCLNLDDVSIKSVEAIGNSAFIADYSLYQIKLPSSLTSIGSNAFMNCYKLIYVLNESSLSISTGSSSNGYAGYYAKVVDTTPSDFFTEKDGFITYNYYDEKCLISYVGTDTNVIVPSDIDVIDSGAFLNNLSIKSISIPENTSLNSSMLYGCMNIEYIDMPYTDIGVSNLFSRFRYSASENDIPSSFKNLRVTGDVNSFSSSFFSNLSIDSLDLACNVSNFNYVFYYLNSLEKVYYEGTLASWFEYSFSDDGSNPMYKASNFYILDNDGNISFGNNKFSKINDLVIPDTITSIGEYQFYGFDFESVTIPSSVLSIGQYAFANCKNLTSVTLNGQEEISTGLFSNCKSLVDIDLKGVKCIWDYAFQNSGIKTVNLSSLEELHYAAFSGCEYLIKVTVPESITVIEDNLFRNCYGLQKIELLGNITAIGEEAFANCYLLNSISLPDSLETLGTGAFRNCETMKSISLKNTKVVDIPSYLFAGCRSLTSIEFGSEINNVGEHAFDNCKVALTKYEGAYYLGPEANPYKWLVKIDKTEEVVSINENCEIIMESAFAKCKSIKSLTIPNSITTIGQILKNNTTIEYLSVPFIGDGNSYQFLNYIFGSTYTSYNYVPSSLKTVAITGNLTTLPSNAFKNNTSIQNVILSDSITELGEYAFYGTSLKSIDLKNVEVIGNYCFSNTNLEAFNATDKLTSIGNYAFANCSKLTKVDMTNISHSCTLGMYLFSTCQNLSNVNLGNAKNVSNRMFEKCSALESISIPSTINSIGQYAFYSSGLKAIDLSNLDDEKTILDHAFDNCKNLTSAILPNVSVIYSYLFYDCSSLEVCEIPESVTDIQTHAFDNTRLRSVTIPAGINTAIGSLAFGNNPNLEEVTINCTTSAYGYSNAGVFSGSNKIKTVVFGEGATVAFDNLFSGKSSLTSVTLPSTLTKIGSSTFYNCAAITSITIPENVTTIGDSAFKGCSKLLEVYNKSSLDLTLGSETNGYVSYYALVVHNDISEESIYEKDSNGFTFIVKNDKGYLFSYDGIATNITLPNSFTKGGVTYNTYDIYSGAFMNNNVIESVVVPGSVKRIGEGAFKNCENLKNVTLEEGIKEIEVSVFDDCNALETLTLPNSLEAIHGSSTYRSFANLNYYLSPDGDKYLGNEDNHYLVFAGYRSEYISTLNIQEGCKIIAPLSANYIYYNCTITIPEGVTFIGSYAFADCKSISNKSISFPSTLKYISDYAFYSTPGLVNILLENTQVEYVGQFAFWSDASLNKHAKITLPNTLNTIGSYAFANSLITDIKIPENVKIVGERAFYGSAQLVNVEIASDEISFGDWQFYSCSALMNVYFDEKIEDWASFVFSHEYSTPMCNAKNFYILDNDGDVTYNGNTYSLLKDIILPEGIDEIAARAFYNISAENVTIPASVTKIGINAFNNCTSLVNVYYDGTINDWVNIDFAEAKANPMYYARNFYILDASGSITYNGKKYSKVTQVNITSEITKLSDYAFSGFTDMEEITLPNTLLEIGSYAFNNCHSLENITIPDSVTTIGSYAFNDCLNLKNIIIPDAVTAIGQYAFSNCRSLVDVILPLEIEVIDKYLFNECSNLTNITIPESVTNINEKPFYNCVALRNVYYNGTILSWCNVSFYNSESSPMNYANNFYLLDDSGTTIHNLDSYELLTDLKTPDEITTIKAYTFSGFNCLNYLTISNNVTTISSYAFYGCEHLWIAKLGSSLQTIGSYAFTNCFRLVEVHIYSSISSSLPDFGKTGSGSGDVMRYAWGKFYSSWVNNSFFDLDSDGHIIDKDGYIFATPFTTNFYQGYLIDYIGNETDLVLPSSYTYDGNNVSKYGINRYAFYKNDKITSVVIPNSINGYNYNGTFFKQIGDHAFDGCANLTSVTVPTNFTSTSCDSDSFYNCIRLYEIYNLSTSLTISTGSSSSYGYIARYAKVIHTTLDETSIMTKDSNGFLYMYLEEKYYLIGYIGSDNEITLPTSFEFNGVTITDYQVYTNAFRDYKFIRNVIIPENITSFNSSTFSGCTGLLSVELPDTLIGLGSYTFSTCYALTTIKIPNGPLSIGSSVFYNCKGLKNVIIPKSVKSLGSDSFKLTSIEKIFYEGTSSEWEAVNKNYSNSGLSQNAIVYYYSEEMPEDAGNYWHYVSGVLTIW